ncbi:phospholipase D2-like isoform X2 [Paramacrobiotus metropolitanus]|uniref:phospholipase D2-like isoform X2 n=1 Tax=Paramacrobiotus metropolitanus TaxID=2943436 RepID=UPI0024461DFB|nr:phospholipase D2-like isoform X2 [Paramacrobiotus metropolitanus]
MPPYWLMRSDEIAPATTDADAAAPFIIATNEDEDAACPWPPAAHITERASAATHLPHTRNVSQESVREPPSRTRSSFDRPNYASYRKSSLLNYISHPQRSTAAFQPPKRSIKAAADRDFFHITPRTVSQVTPGVETENATANEKKTSQSSAPITLAKRSSTPKTSLTKANLSVLRNTKQEKAVLDIPEIKVPPSVESLAFLPEPLRTQRDAAPAQTGACPLPFTATLPYSYVYVKKRPLPDPRCFIFIPGEALEITVLDAFRTDLLGRVTAAYTYALKITNGQHEWYLRKSLRQWRQLHEALKILQDRLSSDINELLPGFVAKTSGRSSVARFDDIREQSISTDQLPKIMKMFLEVSPYSLIRDLGLKMKEGYVMWRISDVPPQPFPVSSLCSWLVQGVEWIEIWLVVKETCVFLVSPYTSEIVQVLLADRHFSIAEGLVATGETHGLFIHNSKRLLALKCHDQTQLEEFVMEMTFVQHAGAKAYTQSNLCGAFAPVRHTCWAKWLVEGSVYYEAVLDTLLRAKEDVFISDSWLHIELMLEQSDGETKHRLDYVLAAKAAEGVQIFILLCSPCLNTLPDGAGFSGLRQTLEELCPTGRIQVIFTAPTDDSPWTHNDKFVVVDQSRALLGSISLAFDQSDTHEHRLTEPHPPEKANKAMKDSLELVRLPSARRVTDLQDPFMPRPSKKISQPTKPKQSQLGAGTDADAVTTNPQQSLLATNSQGESCPYPVKNRASLNAVRMLPRSSIPVPVVASQESVDKARNSSWNAQSFLDGTPVLKSSRASDAKLSVRRAARHATGISLMGDVVKDLARHFIERWNYVKTINFKENSKRRFLIPKAKHSEIKSEQIEEDNFIQCRAQALRSVGQWSAGYNAPEDSIHQTLIRLIAQSQHFIYIETESFVSLSPGNGDTFNLLNHTLVQRIIAAYKARATYRVYVILPLLPLTEGTPAGGQLNDSAVQALMSWTYRSISRGVHSLIVQLSQHMPLPVIPQYIGFFGLRQYETAVGHPMTEMIHNHSEVVIVDDRIALLGSASLCDRSLLGARNSEVACVIEDENFIGSVLNGRPWQAGAFATGLRWRLMAEHLGIMAPSTGTMHPTDKELVRDPVADTFWRDIWQKTANQNTSIYEQVFECVPSEEVSTFAQLEERLQAPAGSLPREMAREMLAAIRGHLVTYPHGFLRNETLGERPFTAHGPMPTVALT